MTYFYHELIFNIEERTLVNITKKNTYEKLIPINIKESIKNKNTFTQNSVFDSNSSTITDKMQLNQSHYFFHRSAFFMNEKHEFEYKNIFAYASENFNEIDPNY